MSADLERAWARYVDFGAAGDPDWMVFGFDQGDPAAQSPFGRIVTDAEGTTLCHAETRAAAELIVWAMNEQHKRLEASGALTRGRLVPETEQEGDPGA